MKTSDFYYDLPEELIAQTPAEPRDSARLLVMDRKTGGLTHTVFNKIGDFLKKGDLLVVNNTKVIPARLYGYRADKESVTKYEALLLRRVNYTDWECIMRPARKATVGARLKFSDELSAEVVSIGESGVRTLRFAFDGIFEDILSRVGNVPLPPYIHEKLSDPSRYNTVYSKIDGSAAAPTAGLHFTPELIESLKKQGVEFAEVLLHVGLGTFRPVKAEEITDHKMHSEYYEVSDDAARAINKAVEEGRRVIAVGTTSGRVLETVADENGFVKAGHGETRIFIYPGYRFKILKGMITNFHLPESTLIMYVSAFAGLENVMNMYKVAVEEKYRFFSFGDATLLI
ncbi:MAG: tRNA preQ1(34) S-adenosylmethionine ribosyltransferase-isomerase QueA [Eubacteriales bacterium]|nr:tRNA preQ1(34) S-adenosylmethionine ribosyltransferase-isomerase QueA [Christensenellaceae bacterium]MDD7092332.1 tRNA preQ1(34) S-adenosylmethionine ribosyltransferase-isomerase QueA [Christensenellaceae bacterium]MDY3240931.1 tRNA preQ1(34) S-adenosylmethionine ribosyltransferase-isomerase QueA [Eubacteriales bacterium]